MLVAFIVLAALGAVLLIVGAVLLIRAQGESRDLTAEEVGEDIIRRQTRDSAYESPLAEGAVFRGEGGGKKVSASASFATVKEDLREGRIGKALPPLLMLGGLTMLLVFTSLALLVGLEGKLVGGFLLAVVALTMGRQIVAFVRA